MTTGAVDAPMAGVADRETGGTDVCCCCLLITAEVADAPVAGIDNPKSGCTNFRFSCFKLMTVGSEEVELGVDDLEVECSSTSSCEISVIDMVEDETSDVVDFGIECIGAVGCCCLSTVIGAPEIEESGIDDAETG